VSQVDAPAADWYPDPSGRFQFRYWDGEAWTGHVSTDGKTDWDPPGDAAPEEHAEQAAEPEQPQQPEPAAELEPQPEPEPVETAPAEDQWAPQTAGLAGETVRVQLDEFAEQAAPVDQTAAEEPVEAEASEPVDTGAPQGGTIEEGEPTDTNLVANRRAGLEPDVEEWLNEVAAQVEPRLSRIESAWTSQPAADAARACAYGLLIGFLAHRHPHMRGELSLVAESHPSFTTLEAGVRLDTLEQIAADPQRTAAWLGPLIGNEDVDRVAMLFD
jgi:hypothetical protein